MICDMYIDISNTNMQSDLWRVTSRTQASSLWRGSEGSSLEGSKTKEIFREEYWRKGANHEPNNLKLQTNKNKKKKKKSQAQATNA